MNVEDEGQPFGNGEECHDGSCRADRPDVPVGMASLIITVPLLLVLLSSVLVSYRIGGGAIREVPRRISASSLAITLILTMVATGLAVVLGWGAISNLSSSTNGCLTF